MRIEKEIEYLAGVDLEYLPVLGSHGNWIDRPDHLLRSVMAYGRPRMEWQSVLQCYSVIRNEDEHHQGSALSQFAKNVRADLGQGMLQRIQAGQVVLELARLAAATRQPPFVNAARR